MHPGKTGTGYDHEKTIQEALRRELESAPPALAEPAWARIQAGLAREKKEPVAAALLRSLPWRRLAAAAALLLLFAGAGLALHNAGQPVRMGSSNGDFAQPEAAENKEDLSQDREEQRLNTALHGFTLEGSEGMEIFQVGDHYPAAVYRRGSEKLLWVCVPSPMGLREFVDELGRQLKVKIEIAGDAAPDRFQNSAVNDALDESQESLLEFTADEQPGIAWQETDGVQALLTLSGSPDLHALRDAKAVPSNTRK